MYVMILNGKLHTSKLQKLLSNRIFHKEEKERKVLHIYVSDSFERFLLLLWMSHYKYMSPLYEIRS